MADSAPVVEHTGLTRQPDDVIRPQLSVDGARCMVERLYGLQVEKIKELDSYDDRNYFVQVSEKHTNPNIDALWPHGYVFKVLNTISSQKQHVFGEHVCVKLLTEAGFLVSRPVSNINGSETSRELLARADYDEKNHQKQGDGSIGTSCIVRLLIYIPGTLLKDVLYTPQLFHNCGRYLGKMHTAMKGFHHEGFASFDLIWHMDNVPELRDYMIAIHDRDDSQLINEVISTFEGEVLQKKDEFRIGTIYNDFNEGNVLVKTTESGDGYDVAGLIDFGDMNYSCIVFDISIAIMYLMLGASEDEMLDVGRHALAGYQSEFPLTDRELDVVRVCVAARFAQSLVMATYSASKEPDNEYAQVSLKTGWNCLKTLWATPETELYRRWGLLKP